MTAELGIGVIHRKEIMNEYQEAVADTADRPNVSPCGEAGNSSLSPFLSVFQFDIERYL